MQDRERDFNKDWYFKLNAAPGAEGRQVDVKDWKKLDLPHDWSIFFEFDHNSPGKTLKILMVKYKKHHQLCKNPGSRN